MKIFHGESFAVFVICIAEWDIACVEHGTVNAKTSTH